MESSKVESGRVFILRFDHKDDLLSELKSFVKKENINFATINLLGALSSATIVTGPANLKLPPSPIEKNLTDVHEVVAFGTIVNDDVDIYVHLHAGFGGKENCYTGCLRKFSEVFITAEAVISEYVGVSFSKKNRKTAKIKILNFDK